MPSPRMTKKQVTDIQAIQVELDDDDRELMTMFRSRHRIMNDVCFWYRTMTKCTSSPRKKSQESKR